MAATDAEARTRVVAAFAKYHENLATLFKRYNVSFANGDPSLGGDAELAQRVDALIAGSPETVAAHVAGSHFGIGRGHVDVSCNAKVGPN